MRALESGVHARGAFLGAGGLARMIVVGAVRGLVATVPMTAVLIVAHRSGRLPEYPPVDFVNRALPRAPSVVRRGLGALLHLGIGAVSGVLHELLGGGRPRTRRGALLHGCLTGAAVWAAGYLVVAPALDVLPPPGPDRSDRQRSILVAHLVFGAALGALALRSMHRRGGSSVRHRRGLAAL